MNDFDEKVEIAIGEEISEEEIAFEFGDLSTEPNEHYHPDESYTLMKELSLVKRVAEYLSDKPCCSKNCCGLWNENHLRKHEDDLNRLSKKEKKIVILTVLRNCAFMTEKTRYSEKRVRVRFSFHYEPFGSMCASAFRLLFDIQIDAFKGLLAHLKSNMSVVPPSHGNRGKSRKPDTLAKKGVTEKVIEFMSALAEDQGEYSTGVYVRQKKIGGKDKKSDLLWLPACLNKSTLLRMYQTQYPDHPVGRTSFVSLLDNEPRLEHIKIRSPRTDMCDYCELQKRRIAGIKPHDEKKAEQLIKELAAHQKAYQGERSIYNSERKKALTDGEKFRKGKLKTKDCIEHISIDYGQSIGAPSTADQLGGTYFLQMRNFHLFGIYSDLDNAFLCYAYDEREAGKGSNEVISYLHHFLSKRTIQTPHIRIHADNCRGQNKNKFVMWYFIWLAATGRVKRVEFKFMIKGHTQFIVDSCIGNIKKELRGSDIFCLEHLKEVIDRSAVTNNAIIVTGNNVFNWKTGLSPYFQDYDGISKFQHFAVDSDDPGVIWAKNGFDDSEWTKRKLLKSKKSINQKKFRKLPRYLSPVGFKGGNFKKEQSLYENLRPYVKKEWQDILCPNPETFEPPAKEKIVCPDW